MSHGGKGRCPHPFFHTTTTTPASKNEGKNTDKLEGHAGSGPPRLSLSTLLGAAVTAMVVAKVAWGTAFC